MGSDNKSILAYEDFIGTYAGEVKKTIDYEKTAWGREGETDFASVWQNLVNPNKINSLRDPGRNYGTLSGSISTRTVPAGTAGQVIGQTGLFTTFAPSFSYQIT